MSCFAPRKVENASSTSSSLRSSPGIRFFRSSSLRGFSLNDQALSPPPISNSARRSSQGETIYLHCWGGHGRTGTAICIMLHMMYGMKSSEVSQSRRSGDRCDDDEKYLEILTRAVTQSIQHNYSASNTASLCTTCARSLSPWAARRPRCRGTRSLEL